VSVKTDGLITSELILIADYRTLGLSNPRIIDTLPSVGLLM